MSEAFLSQLPWICETCTLGWANDDVAQQYLTYLLKRVNIILPRRKWHIGTFKEFYPRGQKLLGLNVNQGSEVCIRFRDPAHKHLFLPFHEVLCTTLHELAHCKVRRHDRTFWSLYYDLVRECEALEAVFIERGVQLYPQYIGTTFSFNTIGTNDQTNSNNNSISTSIKNENTASKSEIEGKQDELINGGCRNNIHVLETSSSNYYTDTNKNQNTCTKVNQATIKANKHGSNTSKYNKKSKIAAVKVFAGHGHKLGGQSIYENTHIKLSVQETRRLLTIRAIESRQSLPVALATSACTANESEMQHSRAWNTTYTREEEHIPDDVNVPNTIASEILGSWACPRCTFINQASDVICAMCTDEHEEDNSEETEHNNYTGEINETKDDAWEKQRMLWKCSRCTFNNEISDTLCAMCNSKRMYDVIDCDAMSDVEECN